MVTLVGLCRFRWNSRRYSYTVNGSAWTPKSSRCEILLHGNRFPMHQEAGVAVVPEVPLRLRPNTDCVKRAFGWWKPCVVLCCVVLPIGTFSWMSISGTEPIVTGIKRIQLLHSFLSFVQRYCYNDYDTTSAWKKILCCVTLLIPMLQITRQLRLKSKLLKLILATIFCGSFCCSCCCLWLFYICHTCIVASKL